MRVSIRARRRTCLSPKLRLRDADLPAPLLSGKVVRGIPTKVWGQAEAGLGDT
jgi:hypothetical protein